LPPPPPPLPVSPPLPGLLAYLQMPQHLGQVRAVVEQPLALTELADVCSGVCRCRFIVVESSSSSILDYRTLTTAGPLSGAHVIGGRTRPSWEARLLSPLIAGRRHMCKRSASG